jgi:hypothetical protein
MLAACEVLIGLNQFSVGCADGGCDATVPQEAGDDGDDAPDGFGIGPEDAAEAAFGDDAAPDQGTPDGGADADASSDADAADALPDIAPPTASEIWVHWAMPNPDAAIAPGSEASLPNPMTYAPGDAGPYVYDLKTGLKWELGPGTQAADYLHAELYCEGLPRLPESPQWRVPTRIELVSLIDFTRTPTLDVEAFAFPADAGANAGGGTFWTSSVLDRDADPTAATHWVISFTDGTVARTDMSSLASWVRCVSGAP